MSLSENLNNLIKTRQDELQAKFYEISEKIYKAANPQGAEGFDPNAAGAQNPGEEYTEANYTDVE